METRTGLTLPEGMHAIDGHIHNSYWNDGQCYDRSCYKDCMEAYRQSEGFDYINLTCIPYLRDRDVSLNFMGALAKLDSDRLFVHAGLVYPDQPIALPFREGFSPAEQVDELMEIGFDGMKMLESQPNARKLLGLPLCDPAYDPYYAKLESRGINLIWHVNNPAPFWTREYIEEYGINPAWCYVDGSFLSYEEIYAEVYEVLRRFPGLQVTFAHLFFMSEQPDRLAALFDAYPNVSVDITPGVEMYPNMSRDTARWREIFQTYADRILLGTDFSTQHGGCYRLDYIYRFLLTDDTFPGFHNQPVCGLKLDREAVERILSRNFLERVGDRPRPINKEALRAYVRKYEPLMTNPVNREPVLADLAAKGLL